MPRIAATIDGFQQFLLTRLSETNHLAMASLLRSATGRRINAAADNPSAFLQISTLETRSSLLSDLQANVTAAAAIGADLQTTLDEVRTQLDTVRAALVADEDHSLTTDEKNTNQAAIDTAIATLRGLARTTTSGRRFLDGSADYACSGKDPNEIAAIDVLALVDDTQLTGSVTTAAAQTVVRYTGAGGAVNSGDAVLTLTGKRGSTTVAVTNGETLIAVRDRVNLDSHRTGIVASVSGDDLELTSVDYGDDATIDVSVNSGTFTTATIAIGADAVVSINGEAISDDRIDGNRATYFSHGVQVTLDFAPGFTGTFSPVTITDADVPRFSLSERLSDRASLALPGIFPELLGGVSGRLSSLESGGSLAGLGTNTAAAIRVVDEALAQLATIEGRVDSFADIAVASAGRLLSGLQTSVDESLEVLNSVDDAEESVLLARQETLHDNTLAALSLLQQQQASMVELLRTLAGLD